MEKTFIRLTFRQNIDAHTTTVFGKNVFEDSYREFFMQSQAYNRDNRFSSFKEMLAANPKAGSLHYKTGFSVGLYIRQLKNIIPELEDTLGRSVIPFEYHSFEIIDSDIHDRSKHHVSILYTSCEMELPGTLGDHLLVNFPNPDPGNAGTSLVTVIKLQPGLSITAFENTRVPGMV